MRFIIEESKLLLITGDR